MNTETEHLKRIADEIAARKDNDTHNPAEPDYHLATQAKRVEKEITYSLTTIENFTQRDTFHFNTLSKLVNICDQLYDTTSSVNPNVMVLLELLTNIKRILPNELRPNLKLPKAFIELQRTEFSETWTRHSAVMVSHEVPEKLIVVAGIPFKRFSEPKGNLEWGDYTWLKGYQAKLDTLDWENADCNSPAEALMSLLIGRDFNDDRFYIYCKKYIEARVAAVKGKRNRVLELAGCEKLVLEDTQIGMPCFDAHANSVSTRLIKLIREEIDFVETHERDQVFAKFEFKWNAEMIACFFKLLHDDLKQDESDGTQKFYNYIGRLYRKFKEGGLYIVDEIDSNFHPALLQKIIKLFQNPEINKANAQLLFTSHDTNLMDPLIMRRDQFYFTEKTIYDATRLYSLADLKGIRNNADFSRQYLAGLYGALPVLGDYLEERTEDAQDDA